MRSRWLRLVAAVTVLIVAAAGHAWFWYGPRERVAPFPLRPGPETTAGLLFAAGSEVGIWLPFPHQNLAAWSRRKPALRKAVASLAAAESGSLPLLPARDLALVWRSGAEGGGPLAARATVYPIAARLLRLAGLGQVREEERGGGGRVAWRGSQWSWQRQVAGGERIGAGEQRTRPRSPPVGEPVLFAVRLSRPVPPFDAGLYGVRRGDGRLWIEDLDRVMPAGAAADSLPFASAPFASGVLAGEVCFVALRRSAAASGWEALAVLGPRANREEVVASGGLQIPSTLVLSTGAGGGFELPAARLIERLDLEPEAVEHREWRGSASDRRAAAFAAEFAEALSALVAGEGAGLEAALWMEPQSLTRLAMDLVTVLERSPLRARGDLTRWRALPLLGELFTGVDRVAVLYAGGRGRLFLEPGSD